MVRKLLGAACTKAAIEQGLAGGSPGSQPTYVALGHLYFDKVEDFTSSFAPHSDAIMSSIPSFTDTTPVIQISEVKL